MDRHKSDNNHDKSAAILKEYMNRTDLCDIWRIRNPECKRYTWHRPANKSASRIDMILISELFATQITSCEIQPAIRSDHSLVNIEINFENYKRGPGFWKLNNLLLREENYQNGIIQTINKTKKLHFLNDPSELWSALKNNCISFSKKYSKEKAQSNKIELECLLNNKDNLLQELYANVENDDVENIQHALVNTEKAISDHTIRATNQSIFRSRCKWVKEGETSSKYFFGLEKKNYMSKNIKAIFKSNGKITYQQEEILQVQTKFYQDLYSSDPNVYFTLKRDESDPILNQESKQRCEQELVVDEIFDAVMTMKLNKVGGPDGLTVEFYRLFYNELKEPLFYMYCQARKHGMLPSTTRKGLISLLPKKQKDTRYIKNLRPLTILNVDFKILAKIWDNRLKEVLPDLIHPDQTGFMAGRSISVNLRKSLDIMEYCKKSKIPAMILSIDMEKCFDKIDHTAIYGALRYFGFGENYVKWAELFYTNFLICTQNFGVRSAWFQKTRSVNQGCNFSPSVFLLVSEILAIKLRKNANIKGIKIGQTEALLSQFADDMDLYLPFDKVILDEVCKTLDIVQSNTGLTVSYEKTTMYRIGSIANTNAKIYTIKPIQWSNDSINTLGIDLYYDKLDRNFESVICKMKAIANLWYFRTLTLYGKILIVNALMSSLFVYKLQIIHDIDDKIFETIDQIIQDFIWGGKKAKNTA